MRHTCTHVSADFTCTDHHGHQYGACTACRASLTRADEHQPWRVCTAGEALRVALGTGGRAMVDLVALHRLMAALATMSPRPPRSATPRQRQAHLDRYAQLVDLVDQARDHASPTTWAARWRLLRTLPA